MKIEFQINLKFQILGIKDINFKADFLLENPPTFNATC